MKNVIVKTFLSGGIAFVMAGAVFVGSGAVSRVEPVEIQTVNSIGATNDSTKADGVQVVLNNIQLDSSVKSFEFYLTNDAGEKIAEWSKASEADKKIEAQYKIYGSKGLNLSYFDANWGKGDIKATKKVNIKFVVNGKTFKKNISLLGKDYKKQTVTLKGYSASGNPTSSKKTYYSYGENLSWKVSSKGINK